MNEGIIIDGNRQTPSNREDSFDDASSLSTGKLLHAHGKNQRRLTNANVARISQFNIQNRMSEPTIMIRYRFRPNDKKKDSFHNGKRIITNEHVKITRLSQAKLHSLNQNVPTDKLESHLTKKPIGHVNISYPYKNKSQNEHGVLMDHETEKPTVKQDREHANQSPTADGINQVSDKKIVVSKRAASQISVSNKPPVKINQKQIRVSVKHIFAK